MMPTISKSDYEKEKYADIHEAISSIVVAYGVSMDDGRDEDGWLTFDVILMNVADARCGYLRTTKEQK